VFSLELQESDFQYDRYGRMMYHPEVHPNHGKTYTQSDLEYLCKYWGVDDAKSLAFALGRPEHSLAAKVNELRKSSQFNYYKNLNKYW
jgi:hypothetical protein